jgi:hypothetical protein
VALRNKVRPVWSSEKKEEFQVDIEIEQGGGHCGYSNLGTSSPNARVTGTKLRGRVALHG